MGTIDKLINAFRVNDDSDYIDDGYLDEDDEEVIIPTKSHYKKNKIEEEDTFEDDPAVTKKPNKVFGKLSSKKEVAPSYDSNLQLCLFKPNEFDDIYQITEILNARVPVVLNLKGLDMVLAQRMMDFVSGSCATIKGRIEDVDESIFIVGPDNLSIVDKSFKAIVDGSSSEDLY
ncbi:MAG: cell division protein SepF [Lachnospiraceae bacterium]|nr:cell division protein SepF [Lachnospiraceae bacterium]